MKATLIFVLWSCTTSLFCQGTFEFSDTTFEIGSVKYTNTLLRHKDFIVPRDYWKPMIDSMVVFLNKNKSIKLEIAFHTDYRGSDTYNARLSSLRAHAVKHRLMHNGIADNRLLANGCGEDRPRILPPQNDLDLFDWKVKHGVQYNPGDTLTQQFIDTNFKKKSDEWENAMQLNRRVELIIIGK